MVLVCLYGNHHIEGVEYAFFGENTIVVLRDRYLIPDEIRRWQTGDWSEGEIRIGHEGSRFWIRKNRDQTYTVTWLSPGWQPIRYTGTLSQCADWYNENQWKHFISN